MNRTTSCAQSEDQYRETEERMKREWNPGRAEQDQSCDWKIPGWLNAPDWANWLQFCKQRGWVFADERPHVYGDGVMSVHGQKDGIRFIRACEVPGVQFFSNRNQTSGGEAPFWVTDRRAGLTAEPVKSTSRTVPRRR